jgi:protein O-GlcNAc transferase
MDVTIDQTMGQAVAAHRGGRIGEAEQLYRAVLQAQPAHPDANHNLGVLLSGRGLHAPALGFLKRALECNASNGQYWLSLIEGLAKAGLTGEAKQVLQAGRQRGLAGEPIERLSRQLEEPNAPPNQSSLLEAIHLREAGRFADAEMWLRARLQDRASDGEALALLAHVLLLQKRDQEAQVVLGQALAIAPMSPAVLRNLARIHLKNGKPDQAEQAARAALQQDLDDEETWLVLSAALAAGNRAAESLEWLERALAKRPRYAEALANRANIRVRQKDLAGAVADAEQAVAIKPHWSAAWALLANLRHQQGDLEGTIQCLTRAAENDPQNALHLVNLGEFQRQAKRPEEAITTLSRATKLAPTNLNAWINFGTVLQETERIAEAVAAYEKALEISPTAFALANNLAVLALRAGHWEKAQQFSSQAVALNPEFPGAYVTLGDALYHLKRFDESAEACRRAIALAPNSPEAHSALARTLVDMGRPEDGEASLRTALALNPRLSITHANLLFSMAYRGSVAAGEYLAFAQAWEATVLPPGRAPVAVQFANRARAGRRLRVGYVSGDFRRHAVSLFIEPVFRCHDRERFDVVAYSTYPAPDDTTERLRGIVGEWRSLVGMNTERARQQILEDRIDVLIDLSGHTSYDRLDVFAHRAAPVQAHYLGYFATTGLSTMDYWIGDATILPAHEAAFFSESLWRLPRVWVCYQGDDEAPASHWTPAEGHIRFGSFNNLNKITPATIALWARVLSAVPESTLLLKTAELDAAANRERIAAAFQQHGISPARLDLRGRTQDKAEHMALYDLVDVALDPVGGIGGGTTTCDALWMGAPIVTLRGDRMAGRMTASMLESIGHPEWIAESDQAYVSTAAELAADVPRRLAWRGMQRTKMKASPLCDSADLTRALEAAYCQMFDRWHASASSPGLTPADAHAGASAW